MSYEIEKGRKCLYLNFEGNETFTFKHPVVYLANTESNNVSPQTFRWVVMAVDWHFQQPPHRWSGNLMMPIEIYQMAHYASGGGIKPNSRDVSGIEYLKLWESQAEKPHAVNMEPLDWKPKVSMWGFEKMSENLAAVESSGEYDKDEIIKAISMLPFENRYYAKSWECQVTNKEQLAAALYLRGKRDRIPLKISITGL